MDNGKQYTTQGGQPLKPEQVVIVNGVPYQAGTPYRAYEAGK